MTTTYLGGEANPNSWYFARRGEVGPLPNPFGHTFPLMTHDAEGRWSLVGTGFYVNDQGLFVTARHVIEEVLRDDVQVSPIRILHLRSDSGLFGPSECLWRPVSQCWLADPADVALGIAATATHNETGVMLRNWTWMLSWAVPLVGTPVSTYAFPNHAMSADGRAFRFSPDVYSGHVQATESFRDRVMVPNPYLQVDFRIHGAASGGPIFAGGEIVGINCVEMPLNIDHPPGPGFGAQTRCLADAFLDDVILSEDTKPSRVTFDELVRAGAIQVTSYVTTEGEVTQRGKIVRLDMPCAAPFPAVGVDVYA